jgi:hypothetical protein
MSTTRALPLVGLLLCAGSASAHTGTGLPGGWVAGFMHPVSGLDHLLAMVAVGTRQRATVGSGSNLLQRRFCARHRAPARRRDRDWQPYGATRGSYRGAQPRWIHCDQRYRISASSNHHMRDAITPSAWVTRRHGPIPVKVTSSWLIAIAALTVLLQFLPVTPGYIPDHLE